MVCMMTHKNINADNRNIKTIPIQIKCADEGGNDDRIWLPSKTRVDIVDVVQVI